MNRNQIYINGQPVTLMQKIIGAVIGIAILVGLFFITAALLPFILIIIAGLIGVAWWRTRHIRAMLKQQQNMMNEAMRRAQEGQAGFQGGEEEQASSKKESSSERKGTTLEGDFKEL